MSDRTAAPNVTELLTRWSDGDKAALNQLMPLIMDELKRLAARYMRSERKGHTLQTTALVNEAFVRLVNRSTVSWQGRAQFFALAAQVMRHVLVDHARTRERTKRGGGAELIPLNESLVFAETASADLIALDEALVRLSKLDSRKSAVIEMRFFAGMSVEETAAVLGVSANTVIRDWSLARSWIYRELRGSESGDVS